MRRAIRRPAGGRASQTLLDRRPVHAGTLQEQQLRVAQQDVQLHGRLRMR